ncbi:LytR C-terminal domain-containing protein [Demequina mangrovi]|uniref:LytR C-terminal domain-containing protein n=1 Tax=Demequina mangrovi TaxID=1043493 RepID=UPI000ABA625C|nr:LytR C-terminal domain-containing protein [Demequina mangrovi]
MTERSNGRPDARRAQVRRHRRERQIIVFGVLIIVLAFTSLYFAGVYKGDVEGPFSQPFVTPEGAFESDITLVCPPPDTSPMAHKNVGVRILNGTEVQGLAGSVSSVLEERNYLVVSTTNWGRTYGDSVRIYFGEDGVRQAYTVARNFDAEVDLVLDNREGTLVDIVLGEEYAASGSMRSELDPELDNDSFLAANAECLPVSVVEPEPAPRTLPVNPLDADESDASASPEPSASQS